jgi:ferritin-like metal-binding protein YciE
MARESLQDLYVEQLRDLHSAENQILEALPKMIKKTTHPELKQALHQHERDTEKQLQRLETVFKELGEKATGHKCKGMEGLLAEGEEALKDFKNGDVLDAAIIASAQRVEHYEMAGYGTVRSMASMLGFDKQADLLQETLDEEGEADEKLSTLAERVVNIDALQAD